MRIKVAKSAGFCFGVKRALEIAFKTAAVEKKVYMLGDIVHNEHVIADIKRAGIKKIRSLGKGSGNVLLIRAHGQGLAVFKKAKQCRYVIVDATCPMVREIHRIVSRMDKLGYRIIIIGDKEHDEVRGIVGQMRGRTLVIDSLDDIRVRKLNNIKKACVVVQSTQNLTKVLAIVEALRRHIKEVRFSNTICRPTRTKQDEIKSMPLENDVMIVIGSKQSANTKRLYEIAKSLNPRSYWINAPDEIRPEWFRGATKVGITAGASTPDYTTQAVIERIASVSA